MKISGDKLIAFKQFIWNYYRDNGRSFAWRNAEDPYGVVISEIMLQQTQTYRVAPKFDAWMAQFPDFSSLSKASLHEVLGAWQGLGYNRRGMYTQKIAQKVMNEFNGLLPTDPQILETFPGIGKNSAGSICAFAFNMPVTFIETNIRAVYIHSFFKGKEKVHDKELLPLIAQTVDQEDPREWYYALMDYGVFLKQQCKNPSRKSAHHTTQSKFEGSDRQVRGMIIRLHTARPEPMTIEQLVISCNKEPLRVQKIVDQLCNELLLKKSDVFYMIS